MENQLVATGATDMLIIVGSEELLTVFPQYWRELKAFCGTPMVRLPYIVEYCQSLDSQGLDFVPATPCMPILEYNPPQHLWKNTGEEFDAEWETSTHHNHGYNPNSRE